MSLLQIKHIARNCWFVTLSLLELYFSSIILRHIRKNVRVRIKMHPKRLFVSKQRHIVHKRRSKWKCFSKYQQLFETHVGNASYPLYKLLFIQVTYHTIYNLNRTRNSNKGIIYKFVHQ